MYYIILALSFYLCAFYIRKNNSYLYRLAEDSVRLVNDFLIQESDNDKLQLIQKSTNSLVFSLFKFILILLKSSLIVIISLIIFAWSIKSSLSSLDLTTNRSIIAITIGASTALLIPRNRIGKSGYSELSKLLHRLALNNYLIQKKLFIREVRKMAKRKIDPKEEFLIISGLARCGTTSMMNDLMRVRAFSSLSYANMPFLLCPNTWKKIYNPTNKSRIKERSHNDGIQIKLNSNEALEEYFFKVMLNDTYVKSEHLVEHKVNEFTYSEYLNYQTLLRENNQQIYLAKNNNFLLRYSSMRQYNSNFILVIMFRDPLAHASSLLNMHKHYIDQQKEDAFILEYMNWLGHHEFGVGQKELKFDNQDVELALFAKDTLDYWLMVWRNYYTKVLTINDSNTLFISYEEYCNGPETIISQVLDKFHLPTKSIQLDTFKNNRKCEDEYSDENYIAATSIYKELLIKARVCD